MIQRIQTLFLLIASALLFSMFLSKMAISGDEYVKFTEIHSLLIMNIITFTLTFCTIFLYRHRILQIRISVFNVVILLAYQGWILWLFFNNRPQDSSFTIYSVFPIVSAILIFTAIRYIARDEALVQSTSRIRNIKKR